MRLIFVLTCLSDYPYDNVIHRLIPGLMAR